jgi:hypothetical protein
MESGVFSVPCRVEPNRAVRCYRNGKKTLGSIA